MAKVNTAAPKLSKNRKLGKNKKKSWRAAKVEDIEEFLHDERRQIESGGLVSAKPDESLFVLDTGRGIKKKDDKPLTKKQRRNKPLKSFSILLPDPHSKSVRKADPENFQRGKRPGRILQRLQDRLQSQVHVDAQNQRTRSVVQREEKRKLKRKLPEVTSDLWADESPETEGNQMIKRKRKKRPSALSATIIPHPGASANPAFEDHQELLTLANDTELKKKKEEQKLYNALDAKFPSRKDAPDMNTYVEEMAAGLFADSDEDEDEDSQDESEGQSVRLNPIVRRENRKSKRQRRMESEQSNEASKKKKEAELNRRENMIYRLRTIKSEIKKQEAKQKQTMLANKEKKEKMPMTTRRLGKLKYSDPELDLKLSNELVGSLRELKPEGHLLSDFYKSLQKRNVIEPREKHKQKRKYKLKVYVKKSHRDIT